MKHPEQKRLEGEERNKQWRALSNSDKLKELDRRGMRALRQRRILQPKDVEKL